MILLSLEVLTPLLISLSMIRTQELSIFHVLITAQAKCALLATRT